MALIEIPQSALGPMSLLGSGGQAKVFDVPDLQIAGETGPFVYKQYKPKILDGHESAIKNGMGRLIAVRAAADSRTATFMDRYSIWPLAVVLPTRESAGACGIVIRKFPATCRRTIQLNKTGKNVDFTVGQYFRTAEQVKKIGLPPMTDEARWNFLLLAGMFVDRLHARNVIIGDLSGQNILVNHDSERTVRPFQPMFIDTDGCRLRGEQASFRQLNTPSWEPPEIRTALDRYKKMRNDTRTDPHKLHQAEVRCYHLSMNTDVYKFGLLIQRFLHKGVPGSQDLPATAGPSQIRSSQEAAAVIHRICGPKRAAVIRRAQMDEPKSRPSIRELLEAMLGQSFSGRSK